MDLLKLFQRAEPERPDTEISPSGQFGDSLESEYADVIRDQLHRGGITEECVAVEVKEVGTGPRGRRVFVGMLRLAQWEQRSALRLLLGLPLLQAGVRKAVRAGWLNDVSHFAGLWLHPSGQFEEGAVMTDLRNMILRLEQLEDAARGGRGAGDLSVWSVPLELGNPSQPDPS